MEKYKVCPNCGEHNNPTIIECSNCGTDLMSVKVVDEATENIVYEPVTETEMVKVCECGAENPPAARKCCSCDEDISDILPTPKVQNCCKQYVLAEVSGEYTYDVPNNSEIIIGRENVLKEFISNKSYVSRSHAKKIIRNLASEKKITLEISDTAMTTLLEESLQNLQNGARGIGNIVESMLINPLSRYLFDNKIGEKYNIKSKKIN